MNSALNFLRMGHGPTEFNDKAALMASTMSKEDTLTTNSSTSSPFGRRVLEICKCQDWNEFIFGIPGILCGAFIGAILGCCIQATSPSDELVSWIGIPGTLFIRAIKCLVTPLVFCSLIVGMADMLSAGKAGSIGIRTIFLYVLTTVVATVQGMLWVMVFRPLFGNPIGQDKAVQIPPLVTLECPEGEGYLLTQMVNGTLACIFSLQNATSTSNISSSSVFLLNDLHGAFMKSSEAIEFQKRTLTEALQGQLFAMFPSNIIFAFSQGILLSIIMFAIPFGIGLSRLPKEMNHIQAIIKELNIVLMQMIQWIIQMTPFAIVSLLASSIAEQKGNLSQLVKDVGMFVCCHLLSLSGHMFVFYPLLMRFFVKHVNPYEWIKSMARAQFFAFGSASSMATLPVVIECIDATKQISKTLSRFVLNLGATIGMDGAALGYPIAIVFMAEAEGIGHIIGNVEYFLIILVSTVGAIGSGPVPAAGIVMTMTIWTSVFPGVPLPSTFAYIVATDWFVDRFQTVVNVTCDTVVCRIVAEQVGETTFEQEQHFTDEPLAKHEDVV